MPTIKPRPDPKVPDHEVLRRIGGGAYGEVWLARAVTGALRAVKVVWRDDFEDERGFEREFEGILKYEPISRDHPGLVHILHVGRAATGEEFYYYVMELGDDILSGRDYNAIEYEARTLRSDIKRAGGQRLDTAFCIEVGVSLSKALQHLHDHGLAHRDVKPANVIFLNGRAKLADIGLVALRGQRTFVGTEGFVPPEGPGSSQADVYSLGKVLYEMATGKDRLDFPELPDELPEDRAERKLWLGLNQVVCDVCEPHLSRRTIRSAGELATALERLQQGKAAKPRPVAGWLASVVVGGLLVWGGWETLKQSPWNGEEPVVAEKPPVVVPQVKAFIKVTSTPDGAEVVDVSDGNGHGELVGRTPTDVLPSFVGEELSLRILKDGYQPFEVSTVVPASAAEEPYVIPAVLKVYAPPTLNEPWTDHLGTRYRPLGEAHESVDYVGARAWNAYVEEEERPEGLFQIASVEERGQKREVVVTSWGEALNFCEWLVETGIVEGYLTEDHEARPRFPGDFPKAGLDEMARREGWRPFRVMVRPIPYGRLMVRTVPPGAQIYLDGLSQGSTEQPLLIDRIRPGSLELLASLEGYKTEVRRLNLKPRATETLEIELKENKSVVLGQPWENSLGMEFVPVGDDWMAAVWETRVRDYREFAEATGRPMPPAAEIFPGQIEEPGLHPVVGISRDDAESFAAWLTETERAEDRLTPSLEYRLPSDLEWSRLAGLDDVEDASPAKRDRLKPRTYFWGDAWPPTGPVGNLSDSAATSQPSTQRIPGYTDGFASTAPVGSFPANQFGLHDLCGNAQEWVRDSYSSSSLSDGSGVLRGGGWKSYRSENLYIGARNPQPPTAAEPTYGFRLVLAKRADDSESLQPETADSNGRN